MNDIYQLILISSGFARIVFSTPGDCHWTRGGQELRSQFRVIFLSGKFLFYTSLFIFFVVFMLIDFFGILVNKKKE